MGAEGEIEVEVAYARPEEQVILKVQGKKGMTVEEAIQLSGILTRFPDIDLDRQAVGIFGKAKSLETQLNAGDRVEIYRSLIADPKEVRRKRAAEGKKTGKGVGSKH